MENQPKMESSKYEADLNFQSKFLQRSMHCSKFYRIEILISENSTKHQDIRGCEVRHYRAKGVHLAVKN